MSDAIFNWTTLACAIITIGFNIVAELLKNRSEKAWKEKIENNEKENEIKIDRMNCSNDFSKVMMNKEAFVEVLNEAEDLELIDKMSMSEAEVKMIQKSNAKIVRRIYNHALSFYNELDEFCSKVVEEVYVAEEYIKKDVSVSVLDFVRIQPQYYDTIKKLYKNYNVAGYTQFKRYRLKNIDKFVEKYLQHYKDSIEKAWENGN